MVQLALRVYNYSLTHDLSDALISAASASDGMMTHVLYPCI